MIYYLPYPLAWSTSRFNFSLLYTLRPTPYATPLRSQTLHLFLISCMSHFPRRFRFTDIISSRIPVTQFPSTSASRTALPTSDSPAPSSDPSPLPTVAPLWEPLQHFRSDSPCFLTPPPQAHGLDTHSSATTVAQGGRRIRRAGRVTSSCWTS
jgi:hypothetical protein